jgi:hypothetical protein
MAEKWIGLLTGILFCSVKFGIAFLPTVRLHQFSFLEALAFGIAAGLLGNLVFIYAGDLLDRLFTALGRWIRRGKTPKLRRKFTRGSRRLVAIKSRYGLMGIALLTPMFLSIPLGAFLSVRYFHNKKKILLYQMASITIWTLLLSAINLLF